MLDRIDTATEFGRPFLTQTVTSVIPRFRMRTTSARTPAFRVSKSALMASAAMREGILTIDANSTPRSSVVTPRIVNARGSSRSATNTLTSQPARARSHNHPPADCTTSTVLNPTALSRYR